LDEWLRRLDRLEDAGNQFAIAGEKPIRAARVECR
jgi:hypothetical protein